VRLAVKVGRDPLAEREAAKAASKAAAERQQAEAESTLGALMTAYCDELDRKGKVSARLTRGCIKRNIEVPVPDLWSKPANEVSLDDCLNILRRPVDAGKRREAGKTRSYMRAAYAAAMNARQSADAHPALRKLKIGANPARDVMPVEDQSTPKDRALSLAELRAYYARICAMPGPMGAALRLHLLTGGQRQDQLRRATWADYDADQKLLLLLDPKGRRKKPRLHPVPVLPDALAAMKQMSSEGFVWSIKGGKSPVSAKAVSDAVKSVCAAMDAAQELENGTFTAGTIRATVETRLAAAGQSSDVLGHLLSHGLGGVQARHYQHHDFHAEKLAALTKLHEIASNKPADVVRLQRGTNHWTNA
jgi:integrase